MLPFPRLRNMGLKYLEPYLLRVFHAEGFINSASAISLLVFPEWSMQQMGVPVTPTLVGMTQWFASIVAILAYIGLRSRVEVENIEALLLGDLLWIAVGFPFLQKFGRWTPSSIFAVGVTAFLALARSLYIIKHYWPVWSKMFAAKKRKASSPASKSIASRTRSRSPRRKARRE